MVKTVSIHGAEVRCAQGKPKYSQMEVERRWLADESFSKVIQDNAFFNITDKYYPDTRTRLGKFLDPATGKGIYKLTKKYGISNPPYDFITSIYLNEKEYILYDSLPGWVLEKARYQYVDGEDSYCIDIFSKALEGLIIAEKEYASPQEVEDSKTPNFAVQEITGVIKYTGYQLAKFSHQNGG